MKKYLIGVVSGVILTVATSVLADSNQFSVTSRLVNFVFQGKQETTDAINYQGHLYVPARFVGEHLGNFVKWNDATSTVTFESIPAETVLTDININNPVKDVEKLPSVEKNNIGVSIEKMASDGNKILLTVKINNGTSIPIQLNQIFGKKDGGGSVNLDMVSSGNLVDSTLSNEIKASYSATGVIALPTLNSGDTSNIQLELKIKRLSGTEPIDTLVLTIPPMQ